MILIKNLRFGKRDQMWMINFWGILRGGGFTTDIWECTRIVNPGVGGGFTIHIWGYTHIMTRINNCQSCGGGGGGCHKFSSEGKCAFWPGFTIVNPGCGGFIIDIWGYMWIVHPPQAPGFPIQGLGVISHVWSHYLRAKHGVATSVLKNYSPNVSLC